MNREPGNPGSGDGSRPTTSGGVDNIGAGEKFTSSSSATGEQDSAPAPAERMASKRKNVEASRHDGSAAYGLREDLRSETNKEPSKP
jgi:type IV secretory pathway TrbL component